MSVDKIVKWFMPKEERFHELLARDTANLVKAARLFKEIADSTSLEERRVTGELLQPIKKHCSLVIVEHDLDFIRDICDRLTVLDQGKVLASGTVSEIQANKSVQEIYLRRA